VTARPSRWRPWRAALVAAAWLAAAVPSRAEEPEPPGAAPQVGGEDIEVIAPSRLSRPAGPGEGLAVQVIEREELEGSGARTLQEALRRIPGLHLADEQGNAFQQDLSVRGFTASPVTGLAQGISVFLDGVRINEPAVEEVNFDLVPLSEVERIEVVHGPTAIFGRNTFGGAIHITTRRGGKRLEAEAEADGGSWGRREGHARVAGPLGPLDGYLAAGGLAEDGWRVDGGGKAARAFGKLGLRRGSTDAALSYQAQVGRLRQAGSLPPGMLADDRRQNYTAGDFFRPTLHLVTWNARQQIGPELTVAALGFFRALDAEQFNSSFVSPDTRLENRTRSAGGALQLDHRASLGPLRHRAAAGAEASRSAVRIRVGEEPNAQVSTADDGSALPRGVADIADTQVAAGAFAQESLQVASGPLSGLGATASLRYDRISHDVLDTSPVNTGGATGTGAYGAWVPALGLAWAFAPHWLAAASYSEGFRAPAFLELTCADPDAPCIGLQAGVAPDATFRKLRPVRSRALEARLSTPAWAGLSATAAAFRVDLRDDIYGVTPNGTTLVYFANVGPTRRQGMEATLRLRGRLVDADATWAFTRATFESDLQLASPRVSGGPQEVRRGATLPMVPRQRADVEVRLKPQAWWSVEAGLTWVGRQVLRGDEANEAARLPAYLVARAGVEARWGEWTASVRAQNLLDARFETFGTYAVDGRGSGLPVPFLTPGAPLRVIAGLRWELE
jgi:outer membrane receptor protein involved in Fe transport